MVNNKKKVVISLVLIFLCGLIIFNNFDSNSLDKPGTENNFKVGDSCTIQIPIQEDCGKYTPNKIVQEAIS